MASGPATIARLGGAIHPSLACLPEISSTSSRRSRMDRCPALPSHRRLASTRTSSGRCSTAGAGRAADGRGRALANTAEADRYLVLGRPGYLGGTHELYTDMWSAALGVGRSIRDDAPVARHDWSAMPDEEFAAIFRGLHGGALATGRQLAESERLAGSGHLLNVGRLGRPCHRGLPGLPYSKKRRWRPSQDRRHSPAASWVRQGSPIGSRSLPTTCSSIRRRAPTMSPCFAT